jgi:hypothetical protein
VRRYEAGPVASPPPGPEVSPPSSPSALSIPDWQDRRAALDRLQAQEDQRHIATALHELGADLVRYYGPRRWAA